MDELTEQEYSLLRNSPLLQALNENDFNELINVSEVTVIPKDQAIFVEGEYSDKIYLIISGEVSLYKNTSRGTKKYLITTLNSGECLGELRLIKDQPCSLTVKSETSVKLLGLSIALLKSKPFEHLFFALTLSLAKILSQRLTSDNQILSDKIAERAKKSKQLWFSLIAILTLLFLLIEVGVGFYYLFNTNDFCALRNLQSGYISGIGGTSTGIRP
ncbi:cyclic nucleotide-binding domain-containing protein (plasmid) [Legionella sp. D16C41]|uniref:cyclic nucleotide-binding domain-containing protein n=1 Tax=Legionella sp. D16C41 TaxID=3402688 RepID=UPI003AF795DE